MFGSEKPFHGFIIKNHR